MGLRIRPVCGFGIHFHVVQRLQDQRTLAFDLSARESAGLLDLVAGSICPILLTCSLPAQGMLVRQLRVLEPKLRESCGELVRWRPMSPSRLLRDL